MEILRKANDSDLAFRILPRVRNLPKALYYIFRSKILSCFPTFQVIFHFSKTVIPLFEKHQVPVYAEYDQHLLIP